MPVGFGIGVGGGAVSAQGLAFTSLAPIGAFRLIYCCPTVYRTHPMTCLDYVIECTLLRIRPRLIVVGKGQGIYHGAGPVF